LANCEKWSVVGTSYTKKVSTYGCYDSLGIVVGMKAVGTGIPENTYVSSIDADNYLTLNKDATSQSPGTIAYSHHNEIRYCTFDNFGTITPNGCIIENCVFQNLKTTAPISATNALVIDSTTSMNRIKSNTFINCNKAVKFTSAGVYDFTDMFFYGNAYDIENASGSDLTINVINSGNASTYINSAGGSITIKNKVTLTLTGIVSGSEVRIYSYGTTTELAGIEDSSTTLIYEYNYTSGTYVDVVVHNINYIYYRLEHYLLLSVNSTLPIQQEIDRFYNNPS